MLIILLLFIIIIYTYLVKKIEKLTNNEKIYISKKINQKNEMEYYFTNNKPITKTYREIENKNLKYGSCYLDLLKCNDFITKKECNQFIKKTNNPNIKWISKPCI